ncbi:hypothetical protein LguiB_017209 [Lonicera macranthoides]
MLCNCFSWVIIVLVRKRKQTENEAFLKKPKDNDKRGSHHKGRLKSKKSSISLPRLSSGCKSIQACSESAVVFTQRQMCDMKYTMIEKDDTISENAIQMRRDRKKLRFTDEASGMLCHVKPSENGQDSLET